MSGVTVRRVCMRARVRDTAGRRGCMWIGALTLFGIVGCGNPPQPRVDGSADATGAAALRLASSEPLPDRLHVGRAATDADIAEVDIDIMPDGAGLPPGGGSPAAGAEVYAARCAACHGPQGEGTPLAGGLVAAGDKHAFVTGEDPDAMGKRTIGNYWPYATTLFDYIRRAMPFDRPGSLTDDEVYAVVAWLLWKNEIIAEETVMDASSLPAVEMPARDRFVPDDRETSARVR